MRTLTVMMRTLLRRRLRTVEKRRPKNSSWPGEGRHQTREPFSKVVHVLSHWLVVFLACVSDVSLFNFVGLHVLSHWHVLVAQDVS